MYTWNTRMDPSRRKLLTQSVSFIQANLNPCVEFLDSLESHAVITNEENDLIKSDDTSSGRIVELICILKHKDDTSFDQFVAVLEEFDCTALSRMLKTKQTISEVMIADPRTAAFLHENLQEYSVESRRIRDLAMRLVLMEVYQDDVSNMQDKINALSQRTPIGTRPKTPMTPRGSESSCRRSQTPKIDLNSLSEEKDSLLRQKDIIIQRKDEEYNKLKKILSDTQNDFQGILELNTQYLSIISQMNAMQLQTAVTPREMPQPVSEEVIKLEQKLEQTTAKVDELNNELTSLNGELCRKELEVEKLQNKDRKYKRMLGLNPDENDENAIENQIKKLLKSGKMQRKELDQIQKELQKIYMSKTDLEDRVNVLIREKEKVEFHMRQQEMTVKRMKRQKVAVETFHAAQNVMVAKIIGDNPAKFTLPEIERPMSQMSSRTKSAKSKVNTQYCMFCRFEYQPLKNPVCRVHFRPIRNGKWICCKDDCHRSAGCLQVPHFYIEITFDRKIFLTDGARYLELT